jgi:hypothetical protein
MAGETYNERSALPPMLRGNDDPICALRTRVRDVRVLRVSGRAPSAVFSKFSDVRAVKAPKEAGNAPATVAPSAPPLVNRIQAIPGEFPLPIISRDSSHVRFVNCSGRDAGTAGKVSFLQEEKLSQPNTTKTMMGLTMMRRDQRHYIARHSMHKT